LSVIGPQVTVTEVAPMKDAKWWIERLELERHPEGGYFRETYRARETIAGANLPSRFGGDRTLLTAIYFLLEGDEFSAFHRIKQDEMWHFYDGSSLTLHVIDSSGTYTTKILGRCLEQGETPQAVVESGCVFGATVNDPGSFSLVGCTLSPGFEFEDFEMPGRERLIAQYPHHKAIIERLTRR
jgi:predicted cupin superfamily sugar epimerase